MDVFLSLLTIPLSYLTVLAVHQAILHACEINRVCHWCTEWLMLFNVDKCKVMHFGYNNPRVSYSIDNTVLPTCTVERDIRVLIQDNLKVSEQCNKVSNTANSFWV